MIYAYLSLIFGILALYGGAEVLLRGATRLALSLGMPRLIVGVVIVGMGTSAPELVSSLVALIGSNAGDIALGNVIGSNIANTALIMGIAALIHPISVSDGARNREVFWILVVVTLLFAAMFSGEFSRLIGIVFLGALGAYLTHQMLAVRHFRSSGEARPHPHGKSEWLRETAQDVSLIAVGLLFLILGGSYLVEGAVTIAETLGVSQRVIGLTVVAFGTSCPELATVTVASIRKSEDISLGNILGSNVFNVLAILGICALVHPFTFSEELFAFDLPAMAGLYLFLALVMRTSNQIGRLMGGGFVFSYFVYLTILVFS